MKKMLCTVMTMALTAGLLAGCGSAGSSAPAPSGNQQGGSSTAAPAGDAPQSNAGRANVNIRFSQFANSTDDPEGMANDPIKKAIEEAVNITLE